MKRVRCIDIDDAASLVLDGIYIVEKVLGDLNPPQYTLRGVAGGFYQRRFVDVAETAPSSRDTSPPSRDTSPMFSAAPAVAVDAPFDFDKYNGLKR